MNTSDFFDFLYGAGEGHVCITRNNQYGDAVRDKWFEWPSDKSRIVEFAERHKREDVYIATALYQSSSSRQKANVKAVRVAYGDADTFPVEDLLVTPSVVVETSPGKTHVYWELDLGTTEPAELERYTHAVSQAHPKKTTGYDEGWAANKLLRVPGTTNTKYATPHTVTVASVTGEIHAAADFAAKYPLPAAQQTHTTNLDGVEIPVRDSTIEALGVTSKMLERYEDTNVKDRSSALYGAECGLFELGATDAEVFAVLEGTAVDKWEGVPHRLWADIQRARAKWEDSAAVEQQPPAEGPSFVPLDLTAILSGTHVAREADLMPREDGQCLFYKGLVNEVHGESESGKSLLVQLEAARVLKAGKSVLYIDYEDDAHSVVPRLRMMGVTTEAIRQCFHYVKPEADTANKYEKEAWEALLSNKYELAVIDGLTESLTLGGYKTVDNDDITTWHRAYARPLANRTGAGVVIVDHVTKNADTRGRFAVGGQAKMSAINGTSYYVDVQETLGRGKIGELRLYIAKDRPGSVRPSCGPADENRMQPAARIIVDSATDPKRINARIISPEGLVSVKDMRMSRKVTGILESGFDTTEKITHRRLEDFCKAEGITHSKADTKEVIDLIKERLAGSVELAA